MVLVSVYWWFAMCLASRLHLARAGSCFAKIDSGGHCNQLTANDVTKDECCSQLGVGYAEPVSDQSIFMLAAGIKKETCMPCRETCDNANCGIGKRCIMKKGLPKCVCAPNCKATAAANKNQRANSAKKIAVIQMPETRHLRRSEKRLTPSELQNDEPTLIVANFNRRTGGGKKSNQRADKEKSANEALIYSPIINANLDHQVQIHPMAKNASNETAFDANTVGLKIRSGFFNEHTTKVTSYIDGLYLGNLPKFSHYNPICGSDGKTYKNECQLRKRACRQENKMLDVAYKGHCQSSCQFIKCSNGKNCIEDHNSAPLCMTCPRCGSGKNLTHQAIAKMVCGADGVTYRSMCELRQKSCRLGKSIPLAYKGPCTETVSCNHCSKSQKCLPDLMTHQPKCVVCNYKCPRKRRPATGDQVCGKNNITYHSWCHLMKDSCNTGFFIDIKHEGPCLASS